MRYYTSGPLQARQMRGWRVVVPGDHHKRLDGRRLGVLILPYHYGPHHAEADEDQSGMSAGHSATVSLTFSGLLLNADHETESALRSLFR